MSNSNYNKPLAETSRSFLKRPRDRENYSGSCPPVVKKEPLEAEDSSGPLDHGNRKNAKEEERKKNVDIKPSIEALAVENKKKEEKKVSPPAETSGPTPLINFFSFANPTVAQPKITPLNYTARDIGAPPPKLPKKAHYNCHNLEEETKYIAENASQQEKAIPAHLGDSDGSEEDESSLQLHKERYFKNSSVYTQFNFKYRKIDTSRLQACGKRDMILDAIEANRVVIVDGFTGCGKTTQVPQFILDKYAATNRPCNIIVTQPRRIAAISVAERVCKERGWELGSVVGYQVGMEKRWDKDTTLLTYVTTGVLLQKLIGSRTVSDYTHIIIDEVHERDLESDLLLLVIKKILQDDERGKEKRVKLILMSATLNAQKFSAYFLSESNDYGDVVQAPVIKIQSNYRHRTDVFFLENLLKENLITKDKLENISQNLERHRAVLMDEVYDAAVNLIVYFDEIEAKKFAPDPRRTSKPMPDNRGSVLVFLPGMEEINRLSKLLIEKNREHVAETRDPDEFKWDIFCLHSSVNREDQQKVFVSPGIQRRKIILSTNIAESSVTVPDVVYVIDFCMTKSLCVDPKTNFTTLRLVWASVSQCIQRKGRTGRVADGKVYHLVPKKFFSTELDQDTLPEMLRSNLETVILQLKRFNMGSPKELLALALDPPVISGIERAVANLKEFGALTITSTDPVTKREKYDTCDGDCTFLGRIMTELPISQQCSRLIMLGHCLGVMKETIIIAACLSVKNPFNTPQQKQLPAYLAKMKWSKKSYSDCFGLLYIYKHWTTKFVDSGEGLQQNRIRENERRWARGEYIQLNVLREIKSIVELIEERLKYRLEIRPHPLVSQEKMDGTLTKEQSLMIKMAIAGAFYPNYFHRHRPGDLESYEKEISRDVSDNDLFNTVCLKGFPPKHNGKLYAKHVADYLSYGLTAPAIKFEGQKILAIFDNQGDKIGPINKGVYRAVKKAQIRDYCQFDMIYPDEEADYLRNCEGSQEKRQLTKAPKQIELPPITASRVDVFITHVLTPSHFWIVYLKRKQELTKMVAAINDQLNRIPLPKRKLVPNAFCLAQHNDDKMYYRGKILIVDECLQEALIYFVDYGNTVWTRTSVLLDFSPSHVVKDYDKYPALAVECRLANLKPATVYGPVWHENAIKEFKNLTDNIPLEMEIYAVVKSVIIGTLKVAKPKREPEIYDPEPHIDINELLIEQGFGDNVPEAKSVERNRKARGQVESMRDNVAAIKGFNDEQVAENFDLDFMKPPNHGQVRVCLKGPWSPLELKFQNLCSSSSTKMVNIDNNSVNSVTLDYEPTAPTSRLLVAAHVSVQERSGNLVARDTTIMPALPGLIGLVSMIFAPRIELRTDVNKFRYTGVLCGLGTSPHDPDLPIYPDHDLEVVFDTEITDDDIDKINAIRYLMNIIVRQDDKKVNISHIHKSLVTEIISLLKKERNRYEEEMPPQEEYVWNKLDPDALVSPSKESFKYEHLDIFLPHKRVVLAHHIDKVSAWLLDV